MEGRDKIESIRVTKDPWLSRKKDFMVDDGRGGFY